MGKLVCFFTPGRLSGAADSALQVYICTSTPPEEVIIMVNLVKGVWIRDDESHDNCKQKGLTGDDNH